MNGTVEAANKNIKKIIQKMVVTYKDWHEMLPFSLVYGMEAVLPMEVQIPSLRIMKDSGLSEDDWI